MWEKRHWWWFETDTRIVGDTPAYIITLRMVTHIRWMHTSFLIWCNKSESKLNTVSQLAPQHAIAMLSIHAVRSPEWSRSLRLQNYRHFGQILCTFHLSSFHSNFIIMTDAHRPIDNYHTFMIWKWRKWWMWRVTCEWNFIAFSIDGSAFCWSLACHFTSIFCWFFSQVRFEVHFMHTTPSLNFNYSRWFFLFVFSIIFKNKNGL